MKRLVPYKFEVVAICHVLDENDQIVAEQPVARQTPEGLQPVVVFTSGGLAKWASEFDKELDRINMQMGQRSQPVDDAR